MRVALIKRFFNALRSKYDKVREDFQSGNATNIHSEIFETLEADSNAIVNSINYWSQVFEVYGSFLSNLDVIVADFAILSGHKDGKIRSFEMPYDRDQISKLMEEKNVLTIGQIEEILGEMQNLENLEEKQINDYEVQGALQSIKKRHQTLNQQFAELREEKDHIDQFFQDKADKISQLESLAEEVVSQTETGGSELASEEEKLAKEVLYILEHAKTSETDQLLARRKFLFAVAATGIGLSKIDQKAYSGFNHVANDFAFEIMGAQQSTDPETYYQEVVKNQNLKVFNKVVNRKEINVKIYNIGIGRIDMPSYPETSIIEYLQEQFWEGLDIQLNIEWENKVLDSNTVRNPDSFRAQLAEVNLRNMDDEEIRNFVKTAQTISNNVRQSEDIACIITKLGAGWFQPRSAAGGETVLIDREDENTLKYVLAHEIGHLTGLPHNHGTDVMSYSIERYLRGEFGVLNPAFREESRQKLAAIKELYQSDE